MTTLKGNTIERSPEHPESDILLRYKYDTMPDQLGNVSFHGLYTMDWRDAQLWWDGHEEWRDRLWELDEESMSQVLDVAHREFRYTPPPQYVFSSDEETKASRLQIPRRASDIPAEIVDEPEQDVVAVPGYLQRFGQAAGFCIEVVLFAVVTMAGAAVLLAVLPFLLIPPLKGMKVFLILLLALLNPIDRVTCRWAVLVMDVGAAWEMNVALGFIVGIVLGLIMLAISMKVTLPRLVDGPVIHYMRIARWLKAKCGF